MGDLKLDMGHLLKGASNTNFVPQRGNLLDMQYLLDHLQDHETARGD